MKYFLTLFCLFFLVSCSNYIKYDKLKKDGYLFLFEDKPFSGSAYTYYSNGDISSKIYFKNGIKNRTESYGYYGELITTTEYEVLQIEISGVEKVIFIKEMEGAFESYSLDVYLEFYTDSINVKEDITSFLGEDEYYKDKEIKTTYYPKEKK